MHQASHTVLNSKIAGWISVATNDVLIDVHDCRQANKKSAEHSHQGDRQVWYNQINLIYEKVNIYSIHYSLTVKL